MRNTSLKYQLFAIVAVIAAPGTAYASDGQINFSGQVTAQTCTINAGNPTFTVNLPTVSAGRLQTDGASTGRTPFSISLSGCSPATGSVTTYFEGGANLDATNHRLTNTGSATRVAVRILNENLSNVQIGNGSAAQNVPQVALASGSGVQRFYAEYVAVGGAATAGSVTTSAMYSIVYQ